MALYNIYVGLGGGFGGSTYSCTLDFETRDEAFQFAYEQAKEEYESYAGLYGLSTAADIRAELEEDAAGDWNEDCYADVDPSEYITDEMVEEAYEDQMSSWLCYHAVLASEDKDRPESDEGDEDLQ